MTAAADFLIVGDGIAGLTVALALADRGARVEVLGSMLPGAASVASAGMLAPSIEGLPEHVREIARAARDAYPRFLDSLREHSPIHVPLDRNGIIELADTAEGLAAMSSRSPQSDVLNGPALAALEPALAGHPGAVLHPFDGAVDNVALMRAIHAAASNARVARWHDRAAALDFSAPHPTVHTLAGDRRSAGHVVLAAGAWASAMQGLPRRLPVRPLQGELLCLSSLPIRHVTYAGDGYLIPRGGTLLVGATSKDTGLDHRTSAEGLLTLRSLAERAIPGLRGSRLVEYWAGLRPMTPDGLPILGSEPAAPGLSYACGFSRNGILLAPYLAGVLADILVGMAPSKPLEAFSVTRFDENVTFSLDLGG